MPETHTPLWISARKLEALLKTAPTPLFVYDEKSLVRAVQALFAAFSWEPGFLPRFPVRMDPDPPVLRILRGAGLGVILVPIFAVLGTLLGGIIGAIGGVGAATIYNSRHRKEGIDISWSERAAQDFMLESLLLYLAVAHFGRGRGDWQEGESPEFWKKAVQDAMTEQKVSFQAIRKLTPEEGVEQLTRMTDSLLRGVFMQLYERSI